MLLAIKMPVWLVDFWNVYGNMITPLLVTFLSAIVTSVALKLKSDAKVSAAKAQLQIEALQKLAEKEDAKPELQALAEQLKSLEKVIDSLGEMTNLAFQNSALDPEIKSNLSSINNKMKYGTEENLVKELETENSQLKEQVEALTSQLETKIELTAVPEEKSVTRVRR